MQTRSDDLGVFLKKRGDNFPRCLWIHGDEPLLAIEAGDTYRNQAKAQGFDERVVITIDRTVKPDTLLNHTQAMSLFASRKLIEVRITTKPTKEWGTALGAAAAQLQGDQDTALLVSSPKLDGASSKTSWFSQFETNGVIVPVAVVDHSALPKWIEARLAKHQLKASVATVALIAARVEGNLLAAEQEVRKLALLFADPNGKSIKELPQEAANQTVLNVARYDIYDAVNAMLAGDSARLARTLRGLQAEGEAGPLLLWALSEAIRALIEIRQAIDRRAPLAGLMQRYRIYNPRDRLYEQAARRASLDRLEESLTQAALVDRIIKGAAGGYTHTGVWAGFEALTMRLVR